MHHYHAMTHSAAACHQEEGLSEFSLLPTTAYLSSLLFLCAEGPRLQVN